METIAISKQKNPVWFWDIFHIQKNYKWTYITQTQREELNTCISECLVKLWIKFDEE